VAESLFQRIAAGDEGAVRECLDVHGGRVWALARRFSADRAEAEDGAQEIFISLWKSAHRYDPQKGSEAAFVATIARRRMIDRLRARGGRVQTVTVQEPEVARHDTTRQMEAALDLARVREVIDELETEPRKVVELAVLQGYSHGQVADATGLALGTVKSHVRRSLIKVRDAFSQAAGDER
jgi:RNA polymerase sigma-70 factor (ECF subfamily)